MQLASPHRFAAVAKEAGLGARACSWLGGSGQATIEHMRASHLAEDVAETMARLAERMTALEEEKCGMEIGEYLEYLNT